MVLLITVSGPSCYCFQAKFYVRHANILGAGQTEPHEKDPSLGVGLAGVLLRTNTARALGGAGGLKAPGIL